MFSNNYMEHFMYKKSSRNSSSGLRSTRRYNSSISQSDIMRFVSISRCDIQFHEEDSVSVLHGYKISLAAMLASCRKLLFMSHAILWCWRPEATPTSIMHLLSRVYCLQVARMSELWRGLRLLLDFPSVTPPQSPIPRSVPYTVYTRQLALLAQIGMLMGRSRRFGSHHKKEPLANLILPCVPGSNSVVALPLPLCTDIKTNWCKTWISFPSQWYNQE